MKQEAERAIPRLEAIGDEAGLSQAWYLIGEAESFWANAQGMIEAFGHAIDHAERAGDRPAVGKATLWCVIATATGMTRPEEGLRSVDALAARAPGDLHVAAWHKLTRGWFLAMLGRVDEGRDLVRSGRAVFEDLGLALTLGGSSIAAAWLEEIGGDLERAERELRSGFELLTSLGEKAFLSTVAGVLARCVALRGGLDEAEELAQIGEEAAATDDVYSQALWRQARALIHARRDEHERALELARQALELVEPSDFCELRTRAFEDLAEVHRLAGRNDDAAEALRRAIDVWDRKGAVVVADRLRARLAELTAP